MLFQGAYSLEVWCLILKRESSFRKRVIICCLKPRFSIMNQKLLLRIKGFPKHWNCGGGMIHFYLPRKEALHLFFPIRSSGFFIRNKSVLSAFHMAGESTLMVVRTPLSVLNWTADHTSTRNTGGIHCPGIFM
ncbi:hypothetical protein SDC9_125541 [bioreactor metagenome]|uniref:Uncharacterized protein n=1 Tax=bioreactor metagenome TaxID=1076179 RepID=A0A645CNA5_9ZZZZ